MTTDTLTTGYTELEAASFRESGGDAATISVRDTNNLSTLWLRTLTPNQSDKVDWHHALALPAGLSVVTTGSVVYSMSFNAGNPVPVDPTESGIDFPDVAWGTASNNETADVLVPDVAIWGVGPFPVVFLMHGGGFVVGDKAAMYSMTFSGNLPLRFKEAGYVCVVLNYPLSRFPGTNTYGDNGDPTVNNPAGSPEDAVLEAIAYFRTHAATYSIDSNKVAITGGSAGGSYALYAAAALDGLSYLKSVIAFSPGTEYRIDLARDPATETYGQYLQRLYANSIHAFEIVEHMGLEGLADDGTGLNQDNAACAAACADASPVVKVATTTAQCRTHVFCSSSEIIPAAVVMDYVDAANTAGVDYTFDVNGNDQDEVAVGVTLEEYAVSLDLDYCLFNETDSDKHADYPGGAERYLAYLAADFATL